MGTIDRIARIIVAIAIIIMIVFNVFTCIAAIILGIFAGVFIVTSILGFCPLYYPFGIHTLRTKSGPDD